jgi:hypothetical protein
LRSREGDGALPADDDNGVLHMDGSSDVPSGSGGNTTVPVIGVVRLRIKDPLTPAISLEFYSWNGRGGPSNLVPEPRS